MRFSVRFADKIVGTLVALALAILVVVIFMLGRSQRWFKHDYTYLSYFPSGAGLTKNMPVQFKGFTIGNVKDFRLADNDSVEVEFTIYEEYNSRVKEGSLVEINVSPIGLGSSFIFYPGRGTEQLEEGSVIFEVTSSMGKQMIASGLASKTESGDSISNIVNQVSTLLETINISLEGSAGADQYPLGQILINIEDITANIEDITAGIASYDGTVMSILDAEGPFYRDLTALLNSLSGILDDVNRTTDVLPAQLPIILTDLSMGLMQLQDVLQAIANNPLLRGGIPKRTESGPGSAGPRNLEF